MWYAHVEGQHASRRRTVAEAGGFGAGNVIVGSGEKVCVLVAVKA
jgi:hypothetical protein